MPPKPIVIVAYDPRWPQQFEAERASLADLFSEAAASIEHIGSTAVPGLGAKPIIDIMLGVGVLQEVESRIPSLESFGYEYVPELEVELPERRYFRKPREGARTHHLHCLSRSSDFWRRHLVFRDHLRRHPDDARAYFQLKQRLASEHHTDGLAYAKAKSRFIESIVEKAAREITGAA
jgi:GrpB-like predicted nucleotidyltransferase (UPF0157 family)